MSGSYKQLNIEERRKIERWLNAKVPVRQMARMLKRWKATLYRELKRNYFVDRSLPRDDLPLHLFQGRHGAGALVVSAGAPEVPQAAAGQKAPAPEIRP